MFIIVKFCNMFLKGYPLETKTAPNKPDLPNMTVWYLSLWLCSSCDECVGVLGHIVTMSLVSL